MMWILFGHKGVFMSIPCYCLCRSPNHANTLSKPRDFCLRSTMCSHLSHKHLLILFFSLNRVACMLNAPHAFTACKKKFATHTYAWCTVIKITFCMIDWILTRQWQHDLWDVFHPWWCKWLLYLESLIVAKVCEGNGWCCLLLVTIMVCFRLLLQ